MADFFLSNLKSTLDNCITELDEIYSMFCRNPESDFTRNRKLSFREYIQFMHQMQSKSVSNAVNICRAYLKHDGNETKSNIESGVAYTIRELLKRQGGKADGENIRNL